MKSFRTLSLLLATLLLGLGVSLQTASAQGLAERRAIKEYQEKKYPDLKKKIDEAAGFEVKVTVNWDELTVEGQSENYMNDTYFSDIYFYPLIEALKSVTKDEMGKQALKAKLKEVVIKYDSSTAPISNYEEGWPFKDGILTINYQPGVNSSGRDSSEFKDRVSALTKNLEKGL